MVYVFRKEADRWRREAELVEPSARWGAALSLNEEGTLLAVGAPGSESSQLPADLVPGEVSLFRREGGVWKREASLQVDPPRGGDEFGSSVAFDASGERLFIGAPGEDGAGGESDAGAVFVFEKASGSDWRQAARLLATFPRSGSRFGSCLSANAAGDLLVVGAPFEDLEAPESGAVYAYRRGEELWSANSYLKSPRVRAGDGFGSAVALSVDGGTLVVGSPFEDGGASGAVEREDAGAAYVYRDDRGVWEETAHLISPSGAQGFAERLALSGDGSTLGIGHSKESSGAPGVMKAVESRPDEASESGAVFVFQREAGWGLVSRVKSPQPHAGERLGASVALDHTGRTLITGAPFAPGRDRAGAVDNAGIVYVY